ncbi:hypothetical protein [Kribbella deserti]|uniref:Uncharacterized protein n=1 Tax=Kribbella deserti TaxID=1926257 RepID=A0ABV6QVH3_9ACTN
MAWHYWVPALAGLFLLFAIICAVKFHHASQVFDQLISSVDQARDDELAQRRDRHAGLIHHPRLRHRHH